MCLLSDESSPSGSAKISFEAFSKGLRDLGLVERQLSRLSATIPIMFARVGDPVGSGLVRSFAQPGGNLNGVSIITVDFKREMARVAQGDPPRRHAGGRASKDGLRFDPPASATVGRHIRTVC